ncbi:transcription factor HES-1 [Elysia marginata]|uniref:Transcription factor HES-1 n=1 Tax=Elysia marginata TaxID=1093978 RepID=A0AAV4JMJ0_9GAST|nr:transcription factor HES-1 [Elysia marginata]
MDRPTFTNVCEATSQSHELDNMRPIHRKGKKLLAEKKRRARINNCLIQIRDLVCEGENDKDSDIDKMEKAEILEKTLEVLTRFRRECNSSNLSSCGSSSSSLHSSPSARQVMAVRYASGFSSCAEESIRYIQSSRLVPAEVKAQLQNHLRSIARRMENRVVEVEAVPQVSPAPVQFPHQYAVHPYPTPMSAVYPRGVPSGTLPGTNLVSSSVPLEEEPTSGFRIPSPIHSSTPVTTLPHQRDQENIMGVKPASLTGGISASRRYECITPEIDVVAEVDDSLKNEPTLSQSQIARLEHYQPLPTSPELATSCPPDCGGNSPRLPLTSVPAYSPPHQTFLDTPPTSFHRKGIAPPQLSSQSAMPAVFLHPYQTSDTPSSPPSAFSSPVSPSSSRTIFTYHGYEPLPATSVSATSTPTRQCFHPLTSSTTNTLSSPVSVRPTLVGKPQATTPSTPALDLCVKRHGSHQISPETMWRPW